MHIAMHSNQRLAKLKRSPVDFYLLTLNKLQSLVRVLDVTEKYSANFFYTIMVHWQFAD